MTILFVPPNRMISNYSINRIICKQYEYKTFSINVSGINYFQLPFRRIGKTDTT
jgi:hypothetical protein